MSLKKFFLYLILAVCAVNTSVAHAQTTVWNTPSTDVQPQGAIYVEGDFISHLASYQDGGYQSYGARVIYGARRRMEVGLNAFYTKVGGGSLPVELQPNVKWQLYQNEDKGLQAVVGGIAYIPVTKRAGTDTSGMAYASVSKKIKGNYAPRLTGGAYAMLAANQRAGTRGGAFVGYEQPLHRRVSFLADWYSGKNRLGYAGGGLAFTTSKRSVLLVGYSVGNQGRGNNNLAVMYAYTF